MSMDKPKTPIEGGVPFDFKAEIVPLSKLTELDYEKERCDAAKRLGVPPPALDECVTVIRFRETGADKAEPFPAVEPWPSPVNAAELLDSVRNIVGRFIICDAVVLAAVALWVAFTWLIDKARIAPLLAITAPEKKCGKSLLLSLVGRLSRRPLPASNISTAAVYRVIEAYAPTLLLDEADTFLGRHEELWGILNSGHTRESAYSIRSHGSNNEVKKFSTWGAKAIAGIGRLPETIADRSIVIELRRKRAGERVDRLRHVEHGHFEQLSRMLARFAEDAGETIGNMRPILPPELNDRAQDNWEPLLAIADYAGGHWPETTRAAALRLSGVSCEALSSSAELLGDIRDIFEQQGNGKIKTADLLTALNADEEKPWATYSRGRSLTARDLAKLLREYHITSRNIWAGCGRSPKGYIRDQFEDAFARYLPAKPPEPANAPPRADGNPERPLRRTKGGLAMWTPPSPPQKPVLSPNVSFLAHSGLSKPIAACVLPSASPNALESLGSSGIAGKLGDIGDDFEL